MPMDLTDGKTTLVRVMAWCRQATSELVLTKISGAIRPHWVKCPLVLILFSLLDMCRHMIKITYVHFFNNGITTFRKMHHGGWNSVASLYRKCRAKRWTKISEKDRQKTKWRLPKPMTALARDPLCRFVILFFCSMFACCLSEQTFPAN